METIEAIADDSELPNPTDPEPNPSDPDPSDPETYTCHGDDGDDIPKQLCRAKNEKVVCEREKEPRGGREKW